MQGDEHPHVMILLCKRQQNQPHILENEAHFVCHWLLLTYTSITPPEALLTASSIPSHFAWLLIAV